MCYAQRQGERKIRRRTRRILRIVFLCSATLLSEVRRTRSPSRRLKTDLWDDESGCPDNEAVQANQIAPSGQRKSTSQSGRSFRTAKAYKPIGSLFQESEAVQANRIAPSGQQSRTIQLGRSFRTAKPYNYARGTD